MRLSSWLWGVLAGAVVAALVVLVLPEPAQRMRAGVPRAPDCGWHLIYLNCDVVVPEREQCHWDPAWQCSEKE